jgi:hypothetical protein
MPADKEKEMLWLLCAMVTVLAGAYVVLPLFRDSKTATDVDLLPETELDRLMDRKSVIYRNIKDLEFEHAMGRLSDADFRRLEADYKNEAAALLAKLDQLGASENLDETIERDIASRKAKLFPAGSARGKELPRCPACGAEVVAGKKFCADCGQRL